MSEAERPLVRARNLQVQFVSPEATVYAVNGVDLDLRAREVLCILGESGSGKSVTLRALMRLNPPARTRVTGVLEVDGNDIIGLPEAQVADLRGKLVSIISQDPMTALDPVFTIGRQIAETILRHENISRREAQRRALDLLELVQIPSARRRLGAYPHELSGGLRQRAMIAIALSCRPKLLLADEPTTALDATVQIQILLLLRRLQEELGMAMIFVTHDLGVASEISERVAVMYAGHLLEEGSTIDLMRTPLHPYARGLLKTTVHPSKHGADLPTIAGAPPDLRQVLPGCPFAPRCDEMEPACCIELPPMRSAVSGHSARCIHIA